MELLIESCHYHETFRELNHHHATTMAMPLLPNKTLKSSQKISHTKIISLKKLLCNELAYTLLFI
jgi:hypothetical protein